MLTGRDRHHGGPWRVSFTLEGKIEQHDREIGILFEHFQNLLEPRGRSGYFPLASSLFMCHVSLE